MQRLINGLAVNVLVAVAVDGDDCTDDMCCDLRLCVRASEKECVRQKLRCREKEQL